MVTQEGGFFSFLTGEGTYREEVFQRDLAVIQAAYYDHGFINVRRSTSPPSRSRRTSATSTSPSRSRRASRTTSASWTSRGDLIVAKEAAARRR